MFHKHKKCSPLNYDIYPTIGVYTLNTTTNDQSTQLYLDIRFSQRQELRTGAEIH